jgi:hypothetical protein
VRVKSQEWALEIKRRPVEGFAEVESPLIRKVREGVGHPLTGPPARRTARRLTRTIPKHEWPR